MTEMQEIAGLGEVADRYDLVLFDQYGVLHDGTRLYNGTIEALSRLAEGGRRSVIVTNSGKRAAANRNRLLRLGLDRALFLDVVSSGEVAWRSIAAGTLGEPFRPGARVHIVGRAGDDYAFDDLALLNVGARELPEFILMLGSNAPATSLGEYARLLAPAAERRVPALCGNPDRLMLTAHGLASAPGAIAARYESMGGPVRWIGKPFPEVYRAVLDLAGNPAPARVLAIGDSIEHDIAGAAAMGFATALVRSGLSADLSNDEIIRLAKSATATPDWCLKELCW